MAWCLLLCSHPETSSALPSYRFGYAREEEVAKTGSPTEIKSCGWAVWKVQSLDEVLKLGYCSDFFRLGDGSGPEVAVRVWDPIMNEWPGSHHLQIIQVVSRGGDVLGATKVGTGSGSPILVGAWSAALPDGRAFVYLECRLRQEAPATPWVFVYEILPDYSAEEIAKYKPKLTPTSEWYRAPEAEDAAGHGSEQ